MSIFKKEKILLVQKEGVILEKSIYIDPQDKQRYIYFVILGEDKQRYGYESLDTYRALTAIVGDGVRIEITQNGTIENVAF